VQGLSFPVDNSEKIYSSAVTARVLTKALVVTAGTTAQNIFYQKHPHQKRTWQGVIPHP